MTDEENGFEGIFDIVFTELHLLLLIFVATDSPHTEKACADMRFVKNFTPPDFQAKQFTPFFSLNFNSFGDKNTAK